MSSPSRAPPKSRQSDQTPKSQRNQQQKQVTAEPRSESRRVPKPGVNKTHASTSSNSQLATIKPAEQNVSKFECLNFRDDIFTCCGCARESKGVRYRERDTNKQFHKECRFFKETRNGHKHNHQLRSYKKIFKCDGCKEEGFGKRFRCDQCGHELHTLCMFPKKLEKIPWLTNLDFVFHSERKNREKNCNACTNDINGFYYHCAGYEGGLYLHPCCINLKHILIAVLDKDGITNQAEQRYTLFLNNEKNIKCYLCNHNRLRTENANYPGWSYVCDAETHKYHVFCVQQLVREVWLTANGHNVDNMEKTLETMMSKQLAKSNGNSSSNSNLIMARKILIMILKMIASTLMGDPTFGIVHLAAALFS